MMMGKVDEILEFNRRFVEKKEYEQYETSKYPDKKIAIVSCMDTRLTELLPAALGIKNGDAKIIKNAGAIITHPYGSVMRSLLVCVYELAVEQIFVIGHFDCGMQTVNPDRMKRKMLDAGISRAAIEKVEAEVNFDGWISGFEEVSLSVQNTVRMIQEHLLIPKRIEVYGFIMDIPSGKLNPVV